MTITTTSFHSPEELEIWDPRSSPTFKKNGYNIEIIRSKTTIPPQAELRIPHVKGKHFLLFLHDNNSHETIESTPADLTYKVFIKDSKTKAFGVSPANPKTYRANNAVIGCASLKTMNDKGVKTIPPDSIATAYGENTEPANRVRHSRSMRTRYGRTRHIAEGVLKEGIPSRFDGCITALCLFTADERVLLSEDPPNQADRLVPSVAQVAPGGRKRLRALNNQSPPADGTGVRVFIHLMDLTQGYVFALKRPQDPIGFEIHGGMGRVFSIPEVAQADAPLKNGPARHGMDHTTAGPLNFAMPHRTNRLFSHAGSSV